MPELNLDVYTEEQLVYYLQKTEDPNIKNMYARALEKYEPILAENRDRFVIFPIQYERIWEHYQTALGSFWTVKDVSLTDDVSQWRDPTLIDEQTKRYIKYILAFFAAADGIVNENLASRFFSEVQIPEARAFYGFQIAMENIHGEMYSLLLDAFIEQKAEKNHLFRAIETVPSIKKMADWSMKWLKADKPFNQRIIAFACVESILFSGPFCAIYWLKKRNILPGLCKSNELISRDEGQHGEFACSLNMELKYKASSKIVIEIVTEAVNLEIEFINEALPCRLIGMNSESMTQYIKFIADRLLLMLGCQVYYNAKNPFDWMDLICMDNKANFFEMRPTEYSRAGFTSTNVKEIATNEKISILDDF